MKAILVVWVLVIGFTFSPVMYDTYVWHQIEKQALAADLVEGAQE